MEYVLPEVQALVVADHVHRDDVSGKLYILGTRAEVGATTFPWIHARLVAYVALVEGRGEVLLRMRLIDADEEQVPIAVEEVHVNFEDPLSELEIIVNFRDLVFPEPGDYRLQLYVDGEFLRERRIVLVPLENPGAI